MVFIWQITREGLNEQRRRVNTMLAVIKICKTAAAAAAAEVSSYKNISTAMHQYTLHNDFRLLHVLTNWNSAPQSAFSIDGKTPEGGYIVCNNPV